VQTFIICLPNTCGIGYRIVLLGWDTISQSPGRVELFAANIFGCKPPEIYILTCLLEFVVIDLVNWVRAGVGMFNCIWKIKRSSPHIHSSTTSLQKSGVTCRNWHCWMWSQDCIHISMSPILNVWVDIFQWYIYWRGLLYFII